MELFNRSSLVAKWTSIWDLGLPGGSPASPIPTFLPAEMLASLFSSGALTLTYEQRRLAPRLLIPPGPGRGPLWCSISLSIKWRGWAPFCALNPDCSGKPPGKMKSPQEHPLQAGLRVTALRDSVIDCEGGTASCPQPRASEMLNLCLPPPTSRKVQGNSTITCNADLWGTCWKQPLPHLYQSGTLT